MNNRARPGECHRILRLVAALVLATGCYTFYAPGQHGDVYMDERTGKPVPVVPLENLDRPWPDHY